MRRLTILLAALGALLLMPVAQAAASGTAIVNVAGSGKGEVTSVGGIGAFESEKNPETTEFFEGFGNSYEGSPPIECSYPPQAGTCETALVEDFLGPAIALHEVAAAGSKFSGWTIEEGETSEAGCNEGYTFVDPGEENPMFCLPKSESGNVKVTAIFECEVEGGCSGPTNLATLTLTKSPSGAAGGGQGSVASKPKGIKCGTTCDSAVAAMYKSTPVELAAKPSTGSTFVKWENAEEGGACDGSTNPICTVPMAEDESLEAIFGGTSKAFSPAEPLLLNKTGSGKGTVKASGLACEAECTSTTVLYQGPVVSPKFKAGKVVILKQAPAFGSVFSGWTGCEAEPEGNCQVAMEEAKEVSAEYTALPNKALTVNKAYSSGNGSVASKPKGIKCAATCTQAVAQMPEGTKVELVAKPGTETAFVEWVGGDCNASTNPVCIVTMNTDETTKAVFSKGGKAFTGGSEPALTLNKAGSGFGTVKASGLTCEVLCSSTTALYQGPVFSPKTKLGKVVVLKATSAPGSKKVQWSGCDSEPEGNCQVAMEEAKEVTATFDELE